MTITEFLLARIAEDEAVARRAAAIFPGSWDVEDRGHYAHVVCDGPNFHHISELDQWQAPGEWLGRALQMIATHDPARVLAECAAKRAIVDLHAAIKDDGWKSGAAHGYLWCGSCGSIDDSPEPFPCDTLKAICAAYASHPDYRQEWAA